MAYYDDLHVGRYVSSRLRTSEVRYASYAQRYVGAVHVDNEEFDAALPSSSSALNKMALGWTAYRTQCKRYDRGSHIYCAS